MVSIVLPNLNTPLQYLRERITSIQTQTYEDWECIIADGHSTNGSWEYLTEIAAADKRFKALQFKKEGIYKAWNSGIELATGKYVYIATSDDTMVPAFLQKMVEALEQYPECAIAHCNLTITDEQSNLSETANWNDYYPTQYFGELIKKKHIRIAPHDGILHCGLKTVYTSITQLLISKNVFDKTGLFLTDKGSIADFEWGMRASLVCNVLHIPEYLASWRIHALQATSDAQQNDFKTYQTLCFFIEHAFQANYDKGLLDSKKYDIPGLQSIYRMEEFLIILGLQRGFAEKLQVCIGYLSKNPSVVIDYVFSRISGRKKKDAVELTREKIHQYKLENHIKTV